MFASNTSQVSSDATYIEDVFSTWLYASTSGTDNQIVNGIDLAGKGGMVWVKSRSTGSTNNYVLDTTRGSSLGNSNELVTNSTAAQSSGPYLDYMTFNSNGFTAKAVSGGGELGTNTYYGNMVGWTFRKQPKFFDVVTYTGNGVAGRTVAHNLGSVPGFMVIKKTSASGTGWACYHTSLGATQYIFLNDTGAAATYSGAWQNTTPTSTVFTLGAGGDVNSNGATYVAYLFAHNAGGFGLTGTDNVISCGSYTGTGASYGPQVNLGFEPQFVMIKAASTTGSWAMFDNMRGIQVSGPDQRLYADTSGAEATTGGNGIEINATGFRANETFAYINGSGQTYIYLAIRRGPMKTPTDGTSVFIPQSPNSSGSFPCVVTNFPVDMGIVKINKTAVGGNFISSRLTGQTFMYTDSTSAETADTSFQWDSSKGWLNLSGANLASWNFRRAPGFFDEVCYTGTGTFGATNHNLGVIPELVIYKKRSGTAQDWGVIQYLSSISYRFGNLNLSSAFTTYANDPSVAGLFSSTQFCKYYDTSGETYVAYLFASCPGVSKVGSYTGNGSTQTINCGFTGGARFVLIKRTDSTGDWYVYDTARGMTTLTDPYLLLNSTAAESATLGSVTSVTGGFSVNASILAAINANGGSYIFLAIA